MQTTLSAGPTIETKPKKATLTDMKNKKTKNLRFGFLKTELRKSSFQFSKSSVDSVQFKKTENQNFQRIPHTPKTDRQTADRQQH